MKPKHSYNVRGKFATLIAAIAFAYTANLPGQEFPDGIEIGTNSETLLWWSNDPSRTTFADIFTSPGSFVWRDSVIESPNSFKQKMSLDATNKLTLHRSDGQPGVILSPIDGKITVSNNGDNSGIFFGNNTTATLKAAPNGAAVFPNSVTLQNGLQLSGGSVKVDTTTDATSFNSAALSVAGGIWANKDSYINAVRIGRGSGNNLSNTVLGFDALSQNASIRTSNTAVGFKSLRLNNENANSAFGSGALEYNTGGFHNLAVGAGSMSKNQTGSYNVGAGSSSMVENITGFHNTALGFSSLSNNTAGSKNIAIGSEAGRYQANGTNLTATTNSIYIGANTRGMDNNDNNSIVIGANAIGEGAGTTVIGSNHTHTTKLFGTLKVDRSSIGHDNTVFTTSAAVGNTNNVNADGSMAIGNNNEIADEDNDYNMVAIGYNNKIINGANNSLVVGGGNIHTSALALTVGEGNQNDADRSLVVGRGLIGTYLDENSIIAGRYNAPLDPTTSYRNAPLVLGAGNGGTDRFNTLVSKITGETVLSNKAWKQRGPEVLPTDDLSANPNDAGNALVVEGHTRLEGKVIISVPQGDISMGIYQ